jgi:hypothetical protein
MVLPRTKLSLDSRSLAVMISEQYGIVGSVAYMVATTNQGGDICGEASRSSLEPLVTGLW